MCVCVCVCVCVLFVFVSVRHLVARLEALLAAPIERPTRERERERRHSLRCSPAAASPSTHPSGPRPRVVRVRLCISCTTSSERLDPACGPSHCTSSIGLPRCWSSSRHSQAPMWSSRSIPPTLSSISKSSSQTRQVSLVSHTSTVHKSHDVMQSLTISHLTIAMIAIATLQAYHSRGVE